MPQRSQVSPYVSQNQKWLTDSVTRLPIGVSSNFACQLKIHGIKANCKFKAMLRLWSHFSWFLKMSTVEFTKSWLMWNAVQFKTGVTGVKIRIRTLSISKLVLCFLLAAMLDFYITGYYIFLCWSASFCSKFVCWPKTIWPFVYFTIVGVKNLCRLIKIRFIHADCGGTK